MSCYYYNGCVIDRGVRLLSRPHTRLIGEIWYGSIEARTRRTWNYGSAAGAALFCLFHGNFKQVLATLVSRDGKEKVVSQAGIGVTKLPF